MTACMSEHPGLTSIRVSRALPTLTTCPICGRASSLEITNGHDKDQIYRCLYGDCSFIGGSIELYRRLKNLRDPQDSVLHLVADGVLSAGDEIGSQINEYIIEQELYYEQVIEFWELARSNLLEGDTTTAGILQQIGCWDGLATSLTALSPHIGSISGSEIKDRFFLPKGQSSAIKKSVTYIVMPLWADPCLITGFIIMDSRTTVYLPVGQNKTLTGLGLLQSVKANGEIMVVCSTPVQALQMLATCLGNAYEAGIVYAHPTANCWSWPITKSNLVINLDNSLEHFQFAMNLPECRVLTREGADKMARNAYQHPRTMIEQGMAQSYRAHKALAIHLGNSPVHVAMASIQQLSLTNTDLSRIAADSPDDVKPRVQALLKTRMSRQTISFQGDVITLTDEGWVSTKKGLISDTAFFVNSIAYDSETGNGTVQGQILQKGQKFDFTSSLKDVQSRTVKWLNDQTMNSGGSLPLIMPGWSSKLWPISRLFQEPRSSSNSLYVGWVDNGSKLILPNAIIQAGSISPNPSSQMTNTVGAGLVPINGLTTHQRDLLVSKSPETKAFWAVFTACCCNLTSPMHQLGTRAIGLIEASNTLIGQMVHQLVEVASLDRVKLPSESTNVIKEAKMREVNSPLPVWIEGESAAPGAIKKWLSAKGDRNCLVPIGKLLAAATTMEGGWIYLHPHGEKERTIVEYESLWPLIIDFISWLQTANMRYPTSEQTLVSSMLKLIETWCAQHMALGKIGSIFTGVSPFITSGVLGRQSSLGGKILSFIIECVQSQLLLVVEPDKGDWKQHMTLQNDELFISQERLRELIEQSGLRPISATSIRNALDEMGYLSGTVRNNIPGYAIKRDDYNLAWTFHASQGAYNA